MTVLVTGGNGLVGSALKEVLGGKSVFYATRKHADLSNRLETLALFNKIKPKTVIHLAAVVGGLYFNMENNYKIFIENTKINTNVMEACVTCGVKKFISVTSTCIFPKDAKGVLTSEMLHQGPPHPSNEGYSFAKRSSHFMAKLLSEQGIQVANLIPTNIYGKNDNYNIVQGHVIPALIHRAYLAKKNGHNLQVKGDGTALRQFIYAKDLARIIFQLLSMQFDYISAICSPPVSSQVEIKDILCYITNKLALDRNVIYGTESIGQYKKTTDETEIKAILPNFKFTDLDVGLSKVVDHFISNYPSTRR